MRAASLCTCKFERAACFCPSDSGDDLITSRETASAVRTKFKKDERTNGTVRCFTCPPAGRARKNLGPLGNADHILQKPFEREGNARMTSLD